MDDATFHVWQVRGTRIVRVCGVLDFAAAVRLRLTLYDCYDTGARHVVVDVSRVRIMDASSISVLLAVNDRLTRRDGALVVAGARGLVVEALEITGVAKRLGVFETIDADLLEPPDAVKASGPVEVHGRWGDEINTLAARMYRLPPGHERSRLRDNLVEHCLPMSVRLATRFYGLGEPPEDLRQVAALALVSAVDRFDPINGTDFAAYATPTIIGAIKRHFRDRGWIVRPPRPVQEMRLAVNKVRAELAQSLNRTPTVTDIAGRLGVGEDVVVEAIGASASYRLVPLESATGTDPDAPAPVDRMGVPEPGYDAVTDHESIRLLLSALPRRERAIIGMRFYGNMTQREIGDRLGLSQMHVSRLLSSTLRRLREGLAAAD